MFHNCIEHLRTAVFLVSSVIPTMNTKNDLLNNEEIVFRMLELLKSNGTFDEFRRHCISDIDAKPTYQNWKQRIDSNVQKFLSKIKYTPELNKNTIRERLRKHLLDGRETHDLEEGADRILTQVLAPRTLSIFESKIEMAVNEYLGIKIDAPPITPIEINGLKESNKNSKNVEINSFSDPKIDLNADAENIEEISPEFEPISSVLDNENSNDESISGMSDLVSVGSPTQINSKEYQDANFNGFETDKNLTEKQSQPISFDKNGINHNKNNPNIILDHNSKSSNNPEKLKTTDLIPKSKHQSSSTSKHTSRKEKSSTHRSKDRNSSSHRSTSREKNDNNKKNSSSSKDGKNKSHVRHHNESKGKDKKSKHDKKSHHSERDKTPKRNRKDSRSDKKEKSTSLCKEPKSLNGNRSDDESNAGGSSKQKSSIHKNKSSTSDKSKSSSSNHKSSRKDNGNKDVVDKPKEKSSISESSNSSSYKSRKNRKRSLEESSKLSNNLDIERKKPKWNDLESSFRTIDEKDAADVLLSMSGISYESSSNEVRTENIIFVENSSLKPSVNLPINIIENKLEAKECKNQNDNEENVNIKTKDLAITQFDPDDSVFEKFVLEIINSIINIVCSDDTEKYPVSCEDIKLENSSIENVEITSESNKLVEIVVADEKKAKLSNAEVNSSVIGNTSNCDSNKVLNVSKLKLKLLPNQIESNRKGKRKKNESKMIKKKSAKLVNIPNVNMPLIDIISPFVNDTTTNNLFNQLSHNDNKNNGTNTLIDGNYFKGFSQEDTVPSENYEQLKNFIKTLEKEENKEDGISSDVDVFRGFTVEEDKPCQNRDIVYKQLSILSTGFRGFTEEETRITTGHTFVKQQLALRKNIVDNQQKIVPSGKNGSTFNKVMTILCENNKDTTTDEIYSSQNSDNKNDCPAVNNNNHNITASDHWVVEQEMKYKLLPVKVKLERLLEYR